MNITEYFNFDLKSIFNENNIYIENEDKLLVKEWNDLIYLRNVQKISKFSKLKLFIKFNYLKIEIKEFKKYFLPFEHYMRNSIRWTPSNDAVLKSRNEVLFSNIEKILINLFINENLKSKIFYKQNVEENKEMNNWILKLSKLEKMPFFRFTSNNYVHFKETLEGMDIIVEEMFVKGESSYLKSLNEEIKDFYDKKIRKYFVNSK